MTELIWDGKYKDGKKVSPIRIALPFQTVETVNETAQERQLTLDMMFAGHPSEWRNRLIWGDKKYVLPSLLPEFAGKINLIYIDPPFDTGADFSFMTTIPESEDSFTKEPSMIEQKAYRDTWGRGLDGYLEWFYETAVLLHELLHENGCIWVHLDEHIGYSCKLVLDEVFGQGNFLNDIIWYYPDNFQGNVNRFANNHNMILVYARSSNKKLKKVEIPLNKVTRRDKRVWSKESNKVVAARDDEGKIIYEEYFTKSADDVWSIGQSSVTKSHSSEFLGYPTQKPEELLRRIIESSSDKGDLILDSFCGSGTTAAVAEKLGRRWITCDLGRFAIQTTRKRLLSIDNVKPFVVQNLGKYERQAWQTAEFDDPTQRASVQLRYRNFILQLYQATPVDGYSWLHGVKHGRLVHVGSVDAPISLGEVTSIVNEFWRVRGKDVGEHTNGIDVLGWDFAFDLNETAKQMAADSNIRLSFKKIPREVLEKKAVEQGDIAFYELAALAVEAKTGKKSVAVELKNFFMPPDDVPEDVKNAITHWRQWIDYWAIDWDYREDTFHNQWQSYRTKKQPDMLLKAFHEYEQSGTCTIVIKVIDILGNDTTKAVTVEIA